MTTIESAHETVLYESDLDHLDKEAWPIVVAYNGINHFVPSVIMSQQQHDAWKLSLVTKMSKVTLNLVKRMDPKSMKPRQGQQLSALETCLKKSITVFEPVKPTGPVRSDPVASTSEWSEGPLYSQAPDAPDPLSGPSLSEDTEVFTEQTAITKVGKKYACAICGVKKSRKPDVVDHISHEHQIGPPIVCDMCNRNFAAWKSVKAHKKRDHKGIYRYNCTTTKDDGTACGYKTDSKGDYYIHMSSKHKLSKRGRRMKKKCPKCGKSYTGAQRLDRHIKRDMCTRKKSFFCSFGKCTRGYKTKKALDYHMGIMHTHNIEKLKCTVVNCSTTVSTKAALHNHLQWHKGKVLVARSKQAKLASERRQAGQSVSKSAPAKIKPFRLRKK